MKVDGKAKQIDLMRNTDYRERSNLLHEIDIQFGCIFNQIDFISSIITGAQRYCFNVLVPGHCLRLASFDAVITFE